MAKKVYIDPGHGGNQPGAVKYVVERDVNLVTALACRDYLESHGVITKMSRTSNATGTDITAMAREANEWDADLVVSIHKNAGGGDGFEVFHSIVGGTSQILAKNIEAEVKKIGQNSRGIKTKKGSDGSDYYGMIRLTNAPSVICEGFFVDNKIDVKIGDTEKEQKEFGYAYARGILKTLEIKDNGLKGEDSSSSSGVPFKVRVKVKDLRIRAGAGTKYKSKGFIKPGIYTITKVNGEWGKLKSGVGWIHLGYTKKV